MTAQRYKISPQVTKEVIIAAILPSVNGWWGMSNGHISAMSMGLMQWRLIKRPLTAKCISNKAVLARWSIQTEYIGSPFLEYSGNRAKQICPLEGWKEQFQPFKEDMCCYRKVFYLLQRSTFQSKPQPLFFLLRAAVSSLDQHPFACASAAPSAYNCSNLCWVMIMPL